LALFNNMTVRGRVNIESNQLFLNGKHIRDYFLPAGTTEIDHALKATKLDNDMTVAAVRFGDKTENFLNAEKTSFAWNEKSKNYQLSLVIKSIPSSAVSYVYNDLINTIGVSSTERVGLNSKAMNHAIINTLGYKWSDYRTLSSITHLPRIIDIAYGDRKFIAIGPEYSNYMGTYSNTTKIVSSNDGKNWVNEFAGQEILNYDLSAIAYANNTFIVFANDSLGENVVFYLNENTGGTFIRGNINKDGSTETSKIYKVVSGDDGTIIAVGGKLIFKSTDGINWVRVPFSTISGDDNISTPIGYHITDVAYGDGKFVFIDGYKHPSNIECKIGVISKHDDYLYASWLTDKTKLNSILPVSTSAIPREIEFCNGSFYLTYTTSSVSDVTSGGRYICNGIGKIRSTTIEGLINHNIIQNQTYIAPEYKTISPTRTLVEKNGLVSANNILYMNLYTGGMLVVDNEVLCNLFLGTDKLDYSVSMIKDTYTKLGLNNVFTGIIKTESYMMRLCQTTSTVVVYTSGTPDNVYFNHTHSQYVTLTYIENMLKSFTGNTTGNLSDTYLTKAVAEDTYAKKNHNHDGTYSKTSHNHDTSYSKKDHTHDYIAAIGEVISSSTDGQIGLVDSKYLKNVDKSYHKFANILNPENIIRKVIQYVDGRSEELSVSQMRRICKGARYYLFADTIANNVRLYGSIDGIHFALYNTYRISGITADIEPYIYYSQGKYFITLAGKNKVCDINHESFDLLVIDESDYRNYSIITDGNNGPLAPNYTVDESAYTSIIRVIPSTYNQPYNYFLVFKKQADDSSILVLEIDQENNFATYSTRSLKDLSSSSTITDIDIDFIRNENNVTFLNVIYKNSSSSVDNRVICLYNVNDAGTPFDPFDFSIQDAIGGTSSYKVNIYDVAFNEESKTLAVIYDIPGLLNQVRLDLVANDELEYFSDYRQRILHSSGNYIYDRVFFLETYKNGFRTYDLIHNGTQSSCTTTVYEDGVTIYGNETVKIDPVMNDSYDILPNTFKKVNFGYEFITSIYETDYEKILFVPFQDKVRVFSVNHILEEKFDGLKFLLNGLLRGNINEFNINDYIEEYVNENSSDSMTVSQITDIATYYYNKTDITNLLKGYSKSTHKHDVSAISGLADNNILNRSYLINGNSRGEESRTTITNVDAFILGDKNLSDYLFNKPNRVVTYSDSILHDIAVAEDGTYIVYDKVRTFTDITNQTPYVDYQVYDKNDNRLITDRYYLMNEIIPDEALSGITVNTRVEIVKDIIFFFFKIQNLSNGLYSYAITFRVRNLANRINPYLFNSINYNLTIQNLADISEDEFNLYKNYGIFYINIGDIQEFKGVYEFIDIENHRRLNILTGVGLFTLYIDNIYNLKTFNSLSVICPYEHYLFEETFNDNSSLYNRGINALTFNDNNYYINQYYNNPATDNTDGYASISLSSVPEDIDLVINSSNAKYIVFGTEHYVYYLNDNTGKYSITSIKSSLSTNLVDLAMVNKSDCRMIFHSKDCIALLEKSDDTDFVFRMVIINRNKSYQIFYLNTDTIKEWVTTASMSLQETYCDMTYVNGKLFINHDGEILTINGFMVNDLSSYDKYQMNNDKAQLLTKSELLSLRGNNQITVKKTKINSDYHSYGGDCKFAIGEKSIVIWNHDASNQMINQILILNRDFTSKNVTLSPDQLINYHKESVDDTETSICVIEDIIFCKDRFILKMIRTNTKNSETDNTRYIIIIKDKLGQNYEYGVDYYFNKTSYLNDYYEDKYPVYTIGDSYIGKIDLLYNELKDEFFVFSGNLGCYSYDRCNSFLSSKNVLISVATGEQPYTAVALSKTKSMFMNQSTFRTYGSLNDDIIEITFNSQYASNDNLCAICSDINENEVITFQRDASKSIQIIYNINLNGPDNTSYEDITNNILGFSLYPSLMSLSDYNSTNDLRNICIYDMKFCNGDIIVSCGLELVSGAFYNIVYRVFNKILQISSHPIEEMYQIIYTRSMNEIVGYTKIRFVPTENGYAIIDESDGNNGDIIAAEINFDKKKKLFNNEENDYKYEYKSIAQTNVIGSSEFAQHNNILFNYEEVYAPFEELLNSVTDDMLYYNGLYVRHLINGNYNGSSGDLISISNDGLNWKTFSLYSIIGDSIYSSLNQNGYIDGIFFINVGEDLHIYSRTGENYHIEIYNFFNPETYNELGNSYIDYKLKADFVTTPSLYELNLNAAMTNDSSYNVPELLNELGIEYNEAYSYNIRAIKQALYLESKNCIVYLLETDKFVNTDGVMIEFIEESEQSMNIVIIKDLETEKYYLPFIKDYYNSTEDYHPLVVSSKLMVDQDNDSISFIIPRNFEERYILISSSITRKSNNEGFIMSYQGIKMFEYNQANDTERLLKTSLKYSNIRPRIGRLVDETNGLLTVLWIEGLWGSMISFINTPRIPFSLLDKSFEWILDQYNNSSKRLADFESSLSNNGDAIFIKIMNNKIITINASSPKDPNNGYCNELAISKNYISINEFLPLNSVQTRQLNKMIDVHLPLLNGDFMYDEDEGCISYMKPHSQSLLDDAVLLPYTYTYKIHETKNGFMMSVFNLRTIFNDNRQLKYKDIAERIKFGDYDLEKDK